jgi:hypothetical protein
MTNKMRVAVVIALAIIAGFLAGIIFDKAAAYPVCETADDCDGWSIVETKKMGAKKFRAGYLHHLPGKHTYPQAAKTNIIDALMPAWKNHAAKMAAKGTVSAKVIAGYPNTRKEVWANFKANDQCGWRPMPGTGTFSQWTCDTPWPDVHLATKGELKGVVCTAVSGASLPAVFAAGASTGAGLLGVGAAWAACMWGSKFINLGT